MNHELNLIVEAKCALQRSNIYYEILGRYGDSLPKNVQELIRKDAEIATSQYEMFCKKVVKRLE